MSHDPSNLTSNEGGASSQFYQASKTRPPGRSESNPPQVSRGKEDALLHLNPSQAASVRARAIVSGVLALVLLACTPDPRNQACTTDDTCKDDLGKAAYCVRSRCVECVSHATCGEKKRCVDGVCESR